MIMNYRDARPIYQQLIDNLREEIRSGVLQPGEKLPSVRELAGELAINPNTIQRAYRELESGGWIVSVPGKGSFVTEQKAESKPNWEAYRAAVQSLLAAGVPVDTLIREIEKIAGGIDHA